MTARTAGITFDLKDEYLRLGWSVEDASEFDAEETVAAIESALTSFGWKVERIGHVRNLVGALAAGRRWDVVFNFAEGVRGFGREAQVPALLDAYDIPYTGSDPLVMALTLHKGMTKRVVRDLGVPTADFAVVETAAEIDAVDLPFPLFVKPVAEGSSKGVDATSRVTTRDELRAACEARVRRFRQPALVETFLPGREMTVGIVGTGARAEVVGVMEAVFAVEQDVYSYTAKQDFSDRVSYRLVEGALGAEAGRLALAAWRGLGCRDVGRMDFRCDAAGRPQFVEVNPLPGMRPGFSELCLLLDLAGVPYLTFLERVMASAAERFESRGVQP